jgi:hypothetical protein
MKMKLLVCLTLVTVSLNSAAAEQGGNWMGLDGLYYGAGDSPHVTRKTTPDHTRKTSPVTVPRRTNQKSSSHQGSPLANSPVASSSPKHVRSRSDDTDKIKELATAANASSGGLTGTEIAAAAVKLQLLATAKS